MAKAKKAVKPKAKSAPKKRVRAKPKQAKTAKSRTKFSMSRTSVREHARRRPAPERKIRCSEDLERVLKGEKDEDDEGPKLLKDPQQQRKAILGRCVGRTFNYEEAKGICQQFEAGGYEVAIIEKKTGGLNLYEVWATRKDEVLI
ncbi:MAG: hypothetical protein ABII22_05130 [Candidatus Micrarchaeota archaeon]